MKAEFPDNKWKNLTKNVTYRDENLNSFHDYQKTVDNLEKEDFFNELKNDYPNDEEIERTREVIKLFNTKNGKELTQLYSKNDVLLLSCVFENFVKVSVKEIGINHLYSVFLPCCT